MASANEVKDAARAAPEVTITPGEEPSVSLVAKPLTYEEADAKIREGADSFSFNVTENCLGRVDVVSLGTKVPSEDHWDVRVVKGAAGKGDTLYAGVYDGHNGTHTANFLKKNLIPYVANRLANLPEGENLEEGLGKAFVSLDDKIMGMAKAALEAGHPAGAAELRAATAPAFCGSAALLLMYEPSSRTLRTALAGDSRAVRAQWSPELNKPAVDVLTEDQNVSNPNEVARITAAHPGEEQDIINVPSEGSFLYIGLTRAFGNHRWKWPAELVRQARSSCHGSKPVPKSKTPPYLTAAPEVTTRVVGARDFVILGSDGLWEAIGSEDAVECVARWVAARREGPEPVVESRESRYDVNEDGSLSRTARPADFAIEDLDNAAVCLLKNVLGGRHRYMVPGAVAATPPDSRYVRDDITVQVVFFQSP